MELTGAIAREHDHGWRRGDHGAELGDGHRPGREHLEEEGLELVVGPVDLVDEQHAGRLAQGAQHRAGEQEAVVEEALLHFTDIARSSGHRLEGADVQDLAREVPVVGAWVASMPS